MTTTATVTARGLTQKMNFQFQEKFHYVMRDPAGKEETHEEEGEAERQVANKPWPGGPTTPELLALPPLREEFNKLGRSLGSSLILTRG